MGCSLCRRDDVDALNVRIAAGESPLLIAKEIDLAKSIVYRHRAECIGEMVSKSLIERESELSKSVEKRFQEILADTISIYDEAIGTGDYRLAAFILGQRAKNLGLEQKLFTAPAASGLCDECEILGYPKGWPKLKQTLLAALEPHPDALTAIARALDAELEPPK